MSLPTPRRVERTAQPRDRERLLPHEIGQPIAVGHVDRYRLAADCAVRGDVVNDIGCGVGYGATLFHAVDYHGYDKPGVVLSAQRNYVPLAGTSTWHGCNLNDPKWHPDQDADVTCVFEVLEHLVDPARVAYRIARWTGRYIVVSVPTIPTKASNPYHLHDFTVDDVPQLFPGWDITDCIEQPKEHSHLWILHWR